MSVTIQNLVFEGGGVKGIAYAGAIDVLEQNHLLQKVEKVAGTSAGAITAALLSLRYNAAEIKQIIDSTDFSSFEDGWDPLRIATKYGVYKGDAFLNWMKQHIAKKGIPEDATFQDFLKAGCRDIRVFATDLNSKDVKVFSADATPTVKVAEAIRASMSIPLFFAAWQFSGNVPDDHIYVDGGTVFNYPLTTFDANGQINHETLGFHLDNLTGSQKANNLKYDQLLNYVKYLFDTLLDSQVIDFNQDPENVKRTVKIDDFGISATDFQITDKQKQMLFDSGKEYTLKYLKENSAL